MQVTVSYAQTGALIATRDGSCVHDGRTTVHADCDPVAHTIHLHVSAARFAQPPALSVRYYRVRSTYQADPNEPGFTGFFPSEPPFLTSTVRPAADGTWSDPGYSATAGGGYYGDVLFRVEVWKTGAEPTYRLGLGEVLCVFTDERP